MKLGRMALHKEKLTETKLAMQLIELSVLEAKGKWLIFVQ